jgi:hypothetical protein
MANLTPEDEKKAWDFLRSEIDPTVKRVLPQNVYGVSGLEDVPEWYLWERLEKSGLRWELDVGEYTYLGTELRKPRNSNYEQTWYLVSVKGTLIINGRPFPCVGGGENRRVDAAFKGALTSMFKNGCKWAGITLAIYKEGEIDDDFFDGGEGSSGGGTHSRSASTGNNTSSPANPPAAPNPTPKITLDEFMGNPLNVVRFEILKEFNLALPNPNAETWVEAAVNLWLHNSEQGTLTPEMLSGKTGGSPINWVFHKLVASHREQCRSDCEHVSQFFERLSKANLPPPPPETPEDG